MPERLNAALNVASLCSAIAQDQFKSISLQSTNINLLIARKHGTR
jgi:hypothetical protein